MKDSVTIIKEYSKTHPLNQTIEYFCGGAGSDSIEWGYSIIPKKVGEIWQQVNKQQVNKKAQDQSTDDGQEGRETTKPITLKIYADNGKAVYEYVGLNEDGEWVKCKGEFKTREFVVKLAKRVAARCNQFKKHLIFEHGRQINDLAGEPITLEDAMPQIGDFCLSEDAYMAVHNELEKASHQSEWGGSRRKWNFS